MEYNIKNILSGQKHNDEVYTPKENIETLLNNIVSIPKDKVIWCPFDKDESWFVIILKQMGYKVINSHIDLGQDFYNYEPQEHWDIIISNPPFSKKRLLIEHCETFKKPFCLLYGCTIFTQSMGNTLNRCRFFFIQKNVKFLTKDGNKKSFQCCWLFNKEFEYLCYN